MIKIEQKINSRLLKKYILNHQCIGQTWNLSHPTVALSMHAITQVWLQTCIDIPAVAVHVHILKIKC